MRHGRKTIKLQRNQDHRDALISNLIVSLIEHKRIKTTLAKAKAVRPFAEKILTLGKRAAIANAKQTDGKDTPLALHCRRLAIAKLDGNKGAVKTLFSEIAPAAAARAQDGRQCATAHARRRQGAPARTDHPPSTQGRAWGGSSSARGGDGRAGACSWRRRGEGRGRGGGFGCRKMGQSDWQWRRGGTRSH